MSQHKQIETPFLCSHVGTLKCQDNRPQLSTWTQTVYEMKKMNLRSLQRSWSQPHWINWNASCIQGLHIQHQFLTSLMFLWLNEQISTATLQNLVEILPRGVEIITTKAGTTFQQYFWYIYKNTSMQWLSKNTVETTLSQFYTLLHYCYSRCNTSICHSYRAELRGRKENCI